jgi:hypothetical protein
LRVLRSEREKKNYEPKQTIEPRYFENSMNFDIFFTPTRHTHNKKMPNVLPACLVYMREREKKRHFSLVKMKMKRIRSYDFISLSRFRSEETQKKT